MPDPDYDDNVILQPVTNDIRTILADLPSPGEPIRRLLAARRAADLAADSSPEGQWLADLGRMLLEAN